MINFFVDNYKKEFKKDISRIDDEILALLEKILKNNI